MSSQHRSRQPLTIRLISTGDERRASLSSNITVGKNVGEIEEAMRTNGAVLEILAERKSDIKHGENGEDTVKIRSRGPLRLNQSD